MPIKKMKPKTMKPKKSTAGFNVKNTKEWDKRVWSKVASVDAPNKKKLHNYIVGGGKVESAAKAGIKVKLKKKK